MKHLDEIPIEDLQRALDDVERAKPAQRLLAAIAYKNGVTQTELAEWHDVQRKTIYSWLTRLEDEPLAEAVADEHRSGRPRKLSADQRAQLKRRLHEPPSDVGYDASAWTPVLLQEFVRDAFDVEYSIPSCRRLLKEAGLRYRPPRRTAAADSDDREPSHSDHPESDGYWTPR